MQVRRLSRLASNFKKQFVNRINIFGPITVAEYMRECLTNPHYGYYNNRDVFGKSGDFTTSPEICQIFGELIGVWLVKLWQKQNCPQKFQYVELGPGRGTLCSDVLTVFSRFPDLYSSTSVHLVEISPSMRKLQNQTLQKTPLFTKLELPSVNWYNHIDEVPELTTSYFIAHEFMDALPVHCFQKSQNKWREVLIGLSSNTEELCFVQSSNETPAQIAYLPIIPNLDERERVEVCPEALRLTELLCRRIESSNSGGALIIDYGHEGEKCDTLRGFHKHSVCDPLINPGHIDLTCDVDFNLLCHTIRKSETNVNLHGPVSQAYFLINMGLFTRLKVLLSKCKSEKQKEDLFSACEMLVTNEQMGSRFKFLAITPQQSDWDISELPGFTDLPGTPYSN